MIDLYIENSRVCFPNKKIIEDYYNLFNEYLKLAKSVHPGLEIPEIKISYSLNRLSETFYFENKYYIIYDQYLGQSFNKLNRILFHESELEAISYLCKILGEENYISNNTTKSIAYTYAYLLTNKEKYSNLPPEFKFKKTELLITQESFVFFHEVAHLVINKDREFLEYTKTFISESKNIKYIIPQLQEYIREKNLPESTINDFFEEVSCDFLAINFSSSVHFYSHKFLKENFFIAVTSAFLYLRTFYDLKNQCRNDNNDIYTFFTKLRYITLREYLYENFEMTEFEILSILDVYDLWEKKIDMNVVTKFNEDFENKLLKTLDSRINLNDIELSKKLIFKL